MIKIRLAIYTKSVSASVEEEWARDVGVKI